MAIPIKQEESNTYRTPRPSTKKQVQGTLSKTAERKNSPGKVSAVIDDFDTSDPTIANYVVHRKVERTNSDISIISKITKMGVPVTTPRPTIKYQKKLGVANDDSSAKHSYTSNRRLVEKDYSDVSQISKSPFLTLRKEPLGQIAGTLFDRGP